MGLDMYLSAKRYLSEFLNEADKETIDTLNDLFFPKELTHKEDKFDRAVAVKEIIAEVAYWRKANAIHNWFVQNVQEGVDECKEHYVSREQLEQLVNICKQVLADKSKAAELLPPTAGFFFGSQEVDEWYMQDLQYTVDTLSKVLVNPAFDRWDFYYCSSW